MDYLFTFLVHLEKHTPHFLWFVTVSVIKSVGCVKQNADVEHWSFDFDLSYPLD